MDFNLLGRSEQTVGFVNLFCFSGVFGWLVFGVCLFNQINREGLSLFALSVARVIIEIFHFLS